MKKAKKTKYLTKVSMSQYAQSGAALPTAYSSAPRPINSFQPINPQLQDNSFFQQGDWSGTEGGPMNQPADMIGANFQPISPSLQKNSLAFDDNPAIKKQRKPYNGQWGDAALAGLLAVDALIPGQKPQHPIVRPGLSYNEHPNGTGSSALFENGGYTQEYAGGGWIKHAINPAHKGWCTPLSNPHCTGHRRALAMRFKHGDLHKGEYGMQISEDGYRADSADNQADMLRIPSNHISMKNVPHPVYGQDEYGNGAMMYPGMEYTFDGSFVDETPIKKLQAGGGVPKYTSYDQINKDNTFARDFASRHGAPSWLAQNSYVARDVGSPMVQFQHTGAAPQGPSKLATTLPTGYTADDVFQTNEGQYGYYNNDSNFTPVDAATIYSLYGKKPKPSIGNASASVASYKNGGKMKIAEQGALLKNYYTKGSTHDLSEDEIKSLVGAGYKLKFV